MMECIMRYVNKISSLEDKASAQVAINLCQKNDFKEVALHLEKPTYGAFIGTYPYFVSDPEKLSQWAKVKENEHLLRVFERSCYVDDTVMARRWDTAVDEQCQRLTEGIPHSLREGVHDWMKRIALEYLSYCRRQEVLFEVSRYFLMDIFTIGDWKEAARLDEKKLAQRLLEDERLTLLQRYRIACGYCLHAHIPRLWKRLTQDEKRITSGNSHHNFPREDHDLVFFMSRHMSEDYVDNLTNPCLWIKAAFQSTYYGNQASLMLCWKRLEEPFQQRLVVHLALECVQKWQWGNQIRVKEKLISHQMLREQSTACIKYNLPSYYSELVRFFLFQMDEEQQLTFFEKAFEFGHCDSVLEYFLAWPYQDGFLPTINQLWGIIPKDKYAQCLLEIASMCNGKYEKESHYYDYRSLLWTLWEETPEEYKQYVFCKKKVNDTGINKGKILLTRLLEISPIQGKDEALFKRIFHYQPQEERTAMMHSEVGQNMCSTLMRKEKWSFVDWLLEECLPREEIPGFKEEFIRSDCGVKLCLDILAENRERLVGDVIDWSLKLDTEKMRFKSTLIEGDVCLNACECLLRKGKFAEVELVFNFSVSSEEKKKRFKMRFAQCACSTLLEDFTHYSWLEDYRWKQMDTIIAWGVDTEKERRDLKRNLFYSIKIEGLHENVFTEALKFGNFYEWLSEPPEK